MQAALPVEPYDPIYPLVLNVSQEDKGAVWSLCHAPKDELQHRSLGFWS